MGRLSVPGARVAAALRAAFPEELAGRVVEGRLNGLPGPATTSLVVFHCCDDGCRALRVDAEHEADRRAAHVAAADWYAAERQARGTLTLYFRGPSAAAGRSDVKVIHDAFGWTVLGYFGGAADGAATLIARFARALRDDALLEALFEAVIADDETAANDPEAKVSLRHAVEGAIRGRM